MFVDLEDKILVLFDFGELVPFDEHWLVVVSNTHPDRLLLVELHFVLAFPLLDSMRCQLDELLDERPCEDVISEKSSHGLSWGL